MPRRILPAKNGIGKSGAEDRAARPGQEFAKSAKITVGEWLDVWLSECKRPGLFPATWEIYEELIRIHIKPAVGRVPLSELRPEHLQKLYSDKLEEGLSPRAVRYMHSLIRQALEQAVKNRFAARNAAEAAEPPWRTGRRAWIH